MHAGASVLQEPRKQNVDENILGRRLQNRRKTAAGCLLLGGRASPAEFNLPRPIGYLGGEHN